MRDPERIQDFAAWVPPEQRQSRFGGPVGARAAETRRPLYRLISVSGENADELFFVNETDETLHHVATFTGGFIKYQSFPSLESDTVEARLLLAEGAPLVRTEARGAKVVKALGIAGFDNQARV